MTTTTPINNVYISPERREIMKRTAQGLKDIAIASLELARDKTTSEADSKDATKLAILNAGVAGILYGLAMQADNFENSQKKPEAANDNLTSRDV